MLKKQILVTGATGFVGRQIVRVLARSDISLTLVVRTGKDAAVQTLSNVNQVVTTPDLFAENPAWWAGVCQNIDTIIHAAWYAEPGKYPHSPLNMECLTGTLQLAQGAVQAGVRRFIGIGTCFEYDLNSGILSETTSLRPLSPYAGAKAATYLALSQYLPERSVEFAWCRLFYLYGEGEDKRRLVPYLRDKLTIGEVAELTTGRQIRDFLDVADAGERIAAVALGDQAGPVNICSGVPVTVRQLAERIADEYGRRDLLRFGAREENAFDPLCIVGSSLLAKTTGDPDESKN